MDATVDIVEHNPQASMPLRLSSEVTTNVPLEQIKANMEANARAHPHGWVRLLPEHDRTLVLCGGGPSIHDHLEHIAAAAQAGAEIWALNGCSSFLRARGIRVDAQVIMDAKPETAQLVDLAAPRHYFCSQVDHELFRMVPNAILWHIAFKAGEPDPFPWYEGHYTQVGGSWTVGNSALPLAYILGFRRIECYGYDSSHRFGEPVPGTNGELTTMYGHAYPQPMNDGEPLTEVEFEGKRYVCSLAMQLQAVWFCKRAREMRAAGVDIKVHGSGLLPDMFNAPPMDERAKYEKMWARREYRVCSPGELIASKFVDWCGPRFGDVVADLGCGTGRGGAAIKRMAGCSILYVDFATNCLDPELAGAPLLLCDLADLVSQCADFAYCTDVLEHIPPERMDATVAGILGAAPRAFLQISTVPDEMGDLIGQTLHLTVAPAEAWLEYFMRVETHEILRYEKLPGAVLFYLSRKE